MTFKSIMLHESYDVDMPQEVLDFMKSIGGKEGFDNRYGLPSVEKSANGFVIKLLVDDGSDSIEKRFAVLTALRNGSKVGVLYQTDKLNQAITEFQRRIREEKPIGGLIGREFPDFGKFPEAIDKLLASGKAKDMSWHNDFMPSVGKELSNGTIVRLWVDYEDPDDRESSEKRYSVSSTLSDGSDVQHMSTDDVGAAITEYLKQSSKKP